MHAMRWFICRTALVGVLVCSGFGLAGQTGLTVLAAPLAQFTPFPTPTPGPDGRIVYIVQANDSWWRIAAIFNIDLNELYRLNDATSETILAEGEEVLLGFGGPSDVSPTLGPSPTPTSSEPTPTPQPGSGTLCVILYNDANGDSRRQEEEPAIPDGAISITDRDGDVSLNEVTTGGFDPLCFPDLPQGEYNISVAVPEGYNPTTALNYALVVEPGAQTFLDFGAQPGSAALPEAAAAGGGSRSLLLGILGGVLLLGGIGLGVYAGLLSRTRGRVEPG
jgi:hypothetical protein